MDQAVIKIIKQYADIVRQTMQVKKIILYGSYSSGCAHDGSNIDIAVIVDSIEWDYLEQSSRLFELVREIDVRIEPVLLNEASEKAVLLKA